MRWYSVDLVCGVFGMKFQSLIKRNSNRKMPPMIHLVARFQLKKKKEKAANGLFLINLVIIGSLNN